MADTKVGFAIPANGKVVHVVVDGKQACDKKITLTPDPALQVTSVTCKKCQRFAFFKAIAEKGEEKSSSKEAEKKVVASVAGVDFVGPAEKPAQPKKKVVVSKKKASKQKPLSKKAQAMANETPEEKSIREAAEQKRKEDREMKKPGPVKVTKVSKNRKQARFKKRMVNAIQESLLVVLAPFQKEEIEEVSIARIFDETQTHLRGTLADACETKEEKTLFMQQWTLEWKLFTTAFEGLGFAKLKGKDPDKGRVALFYDKKAEKGKRKISRRGNKGSEKTVRVISRRAKDKAEKEKSGRVIKRRKAEDKPKEKQKRKERKSNAEKNKYGHRIGTMGAAIDTMLEEGFIFKDAVNMVVEDFGKDVNRARRKVAANIKAMVRKLNTPVMVIMQKNSDEDYYKIHTEE